jgi:uridine phosphorylase
MNDSKKIGEATRPVADDGRQYHLHTAPGSLAERCLLVGAPERAEQIASTLFSRSVQVGDHRGLKSFTGEFRHQPMSVVTTGMGGASLGIVMPEAVRSGAKVFIRVGSCSTLWREVGLHSTVICTGAVRLDGASQNWAPMEYPAVADWRIVSSLVAAAEQLGLPHAEGIGATTACFNEGQARPDDSGYMPPRLRQLHDELVARHVLFYSMEEAALFVWCSAHGGYPAGSVCAVFGNRATNEFGPGGEREAALIAATALAGLDPASFRLRGK